MNLCRRHGVLCVRIYRLLGYWREYYTYPSVAGELLGREDRIDKTLFESCGDSLIVNLGTKEWESVSSLLSITSLGSDDNGDFLHRPTFNPEISETGTCTSLFSLTNQDTT